MIVNRAHSMAELGRETQSAPLEGNADEATHIKCRHFLVVNYVFMIRARA